MRAAQSGHLEPVKLLLAHPEVDANFQNKVTCHGKGVSVYMNITRRFIYVLVRMDGQPS